MTDVWREELPAEWIDAAKRAAQHAFNGETLEKVIEAALAAVLPLIEEHERAGWKQVGWRNKFGSVIAREWAERRGNTAHYEGGNDWRPVYVRELVPHPDPPKETL